MRALAFVTVLMAILNMPMAEAQTCKFNSWRKYKNNRCTSSSSKQAQEAYVHQTINTAILTRQCVYLSGKRGPKVKASCRGSNSIYITFYNVFDEDPFCSRAYGNQELSAGLRLPPITIDHGKCESFGPGVWIIPSISGSSFSSGTSVSDFDQEFQPAVRPQNLKDFDSQLNKANSQINQANSQINSANSQLNKALSDYDKASAKANANFDDALKNYNSAVDDAASTAVGVIVAIIVGSVCGVIICIAICVWACRRQNQTTVVMAGDGK